MSDRPYVRIVLDGGSMKAQLVVVCPWPGLPVGWSGDLPNTALHQWQCCDTGDTGLITDVVLHFPNLLSEPAFTVVVSVDDETIQHVLEKHNFLPCDVAGAAPDGAAPA